MHHCWRIIRYNRRCSNIFYFYIAERSKTGPKTFDFPYHYVKSIMCIFHSHQKMLDFALEQFAYLTEHIFSSKNLALKNWYMRSNRSFLCMYLFVHLSFLIKAIWHLLKKSNILESSEKLCSIVFATLADADDLISAFANNYNWLKKYQMFWASFDSEYRRIEEKCVSLGKIWAKILVDTKFKTSDFRLRPKVGPFGFLLTGLCDSKSPIESNRQIFQNGIENK